MYFILIQFQAAASASSKVSTDDPQVVEHGSVADLVLMVVDHKFEYEQVFQEPH